MNVSRRGGLFVAEHASDEQTIQAALRKVDPDLVLTWEVDEHHGCRRWEVLKVVSRDRPAALVLIWMDDYGRPLPLSSSLVDRVKQARFQQNLSRAEDHNANLLAESERDSDAGILEVIRENLPRVQGKKMSVLHRGQHLRRSRWKARQNGTGHL